MVFLLKPHNRISEARAKVNDLFNTKLPEDKKTVDFEKMKEINFVVMEKN